jgi:DNA anti-recombination protein RmuC
MNTPEERITYIAVEPAKAGQVPSINNSQLANNDLGGSGNLDKVRDLLFGNQVRDFEKRFSRLEERLVKESSTLRDDLKKRLDSLETYVMQEVESLNENIKAEQIERDEAVKEIEQNYKDITKSLEKKITQLDEQSNQKQRELRQQILDQSKGLDDEMRQKYEAILSVIERETQEIRNDKTNRSTLAALFTQMAM